VSLPRGPELLFFTPSPLETLLGKLSLPRVPEPAQITEKRGDVLGVDVREEETPQRRLQVKPDVSFLLLDRGRSISAAGGVRGPPDLVYEACECEYLLLLFLLAVGLTAQSARESERC